VLDIRGYQSMAAASAEKAWEVLGREAAPDLIVLDVLLPGVNGLDFCKQLKAKPLYRNIPVVIITGITRESDLADGFWKIGTGADDFVTKPFDPFDLADRIERLLTRYPGQSNPNP
jgi:CheY-like chemotaxis protein